MRKFKTLFLITFCLFLLSGCTNAKTYLARVPGLQLVLKNNISVKQKGEKVPEIITMDLGFVIDSTYDLDEINQMFRSATENFKIIVGHKNDDGALVKEEYNGNIYANPFGDNLNYYIFRGQQDGNIFIFQTDVEKATEALLQKQKELEEKRKQEQAVLEYSLDTIEQLIRNKLHHNDAVILSYYIAEDVATKSVIRLKNVEELRTIPVDKFLYKGKSLSKLGNTNYNFERDDFIDVKKERQKKLLEYVPKPKDGINNYDGDSYYYDSEKELFITNEWVLVKSDDKYYYWVYCNIEGRLVKNDYIEDGLYKFDSKGRWVDDNNNIYKYEEDGTTPYVEIEKIKQEVHESIKSTKSTITETRESIKETKPVLKTEAETTSSTRKKVKKTVWQPADNLGYRTNYLTEVVSANTNDHGKLVKGGFQLVTFDDGSYKMKLINDEGSTSPNESYFASIHYVTTDNEGWCSFDNVKFYYTNSNDCMNALSKLFLDNKLGGWVEKEVWETENTIQETTAHQEIIPKETTMAAPSQNAIIPQAQPIVQPEQVQIQESTPIISEEMDAYIRSLK